MRSDGILIEQADGEVLLYRNTPDLGRQTPPSGLLRGAVCPHGVRFAPDGRRLFVADAASQYLYVFESRGGEWDGVRDPSRSVRVLDDDSFYAGRYASREEGLKGIDIDRSGTVLVTTRMHRVLVEMSRVERSEVIDGWTTTRRSGILRKRSDG